MVNLRYYVVSLVGVFLALAIGVVLGAGPLQNRINDVGEGTNITERAAQLETELELSQTTSEQQTEFIKAVGGETLPGTLNERKVALVALPGVSNEEADALGQQFQQAGATIVGTVQLTENWSSYSQREYRDTLASPVSSHLSQPAASSTSDAVLAQALVEVLTSSGSEQTLVKEIISDEQTPLVIAGSFPSETADSLVIIGPSASASALDESQSEGNGQVQQALVALGQMAASAPNGAVAVGSAANNDSFITILRSANAALPTVDQGGTAMANLNAVLALVSGDNNAYGQEEGAKTPVAPLP